MSSGGETAVIQSNGAVGVPVSPTSVQTNSSKTTVPSVAKTSASTSPTVNLDVAPQSPPNPAPSDQAPPAEISIQNQVLAPELQGAATSDAPPPAEQAVAASPDLTVLPTPTASPPVASGSVNTPEVEPAAVQGAVTGETTAIPPAEQIEHTRVAVPLPAGETSPSLAAASTEVTTQELPASAADSTPIPSPVSSDLPPIDKGSEKPSESESGPIPSALGDANVFAPAETESPVPSSLPAEPSPSSSAITSSQPSQILEGSSGTSIIPGSPKQTLQGGLTSEHTSNAQSNASLGVTTTTKGVNSNSSSRISDQGKESTKAVDDSSETPTSLPASPQVTVDGASIDTTYVSGSVTLTGAAAISAADFAHNGDHKEGKKNGMSSFAIIGIVGGILVFFIMMYIVWFQWRKRRASNDSERLEDHNYPTNDKEFDPYGIARAKHSGFDFIDQPLSSRRSDRYKSTMTAKTENPFTDHSKIQQHDKCKSQETEYVESWYSDPGEAGLGTAHTQNMPWYNDDRRPSYIDGPQSIYAETNDPSDPFNQLSASDQDHDQDGGRPKTILTGTTTAPPVPPLPAAYRKSNPPSRPHTNFSYGDFYGGYNSAGPSRPPTQYSQYTTDRSPQTATTSMATPSTAAMLPWLDNTESPPLPIPAQPRSMSTNTIASQTRNRFGSPPKMPLRAPIAAAIAQTPQMQDQGYMGVIPTFR